MNHQAIPSKDIIVSIKPHSNSGHIYIPQAISYSFVVVEYVDSNNKIIKSRLEVQRNIHDQHGNIQYSDPWFEVPRIQRPI